jgi:DNA polymerase epsilon subunit 2
MGRSDKLLGHHVDRKLCPTNASDINICSRFFAPPAQSTTVTAISHLLLIYLYDVTDIVMSLRPLINKVFTRKYQFALQADAVTRIEDIFEENEIGLDIAQDALELMAKQCQTHEGAKSSSFALFTEFIIWYSDISTIIKRETIDEIYELVREAGENAGAGINPLEAHELDPNHHFHVIDPVAMPNWQWSLDRKTFERCDPVFQPIQILGLSFRWLKFSLTVFSLSSHVKPSIAAGPEWQANLFRNRHNVIKQAVLRNENFSPPMSGRERANYLRVCLAMLPPRKRHIMIQLS